MSRLKKTSKQVEKGRQRETGLQSIAANLDLGNGLTLVNYDKLISETEKLLNIYNELLSETDAAAAIFLAKEKELKTMSVRMLKGVLSKFGPDSVEYEQAGGVRTSRIKHHHQKPKSDS